MKLKSTISFYYNENKKQMFTKHRHYVKYN